MVLLIILLLAIFWIWQFVSLMLLPDAAFNGRFDKPIWAIALILLNVLGAITFFIWKLGQRAEDLAGEELVRAIEFAESD